jgi:hypothetical protein
VAVLAYTVPIAATEVFTLNGVLLDLFGSDPRPSRGTSSTGMRSMKLKLPAAELDAVALVVDVNRSVLASGSSWKQ